ncbi:N-acetylglucosamine kinase [Brevibacillus ruminantium]|uniref:N-acetylglucosamine kinase n=1 Tax=Brevibacillus ruminantium TaxID=2950604 RepID=A0ABY4WBC0_9BACL|nr:BadF/BadG/BcrA/BcrD ATPase family protein [Brevibacillus ruminantium]USG64468.1 N-acetylglucosamine kinase [Brevibacillus ruminantium]
MQLNKKQSWFIGLDGGGTKTKAALCDSAGRIVGLAEGEGSNPLSRPWEQVRETLQVLMEQVCRRAGVGADEVAGVFLGLAGADRPQVKAWIEDAFLPVWGERLHIDNDAVAALYSGTWGSPGIVLIAGTGSIAYAVAKDGRRHRVGGWGYLLGDEGSGYDLGRQTVVAVLRAWDGRGEQTLLSELLLRHYGIEQPDQFIARFYSSPNPRKELAEASVLAEQAAASGDPLAIRLIQQAADSLGELVETCRTRAGQDLPVVLAGGLLAADTLLRRQLLRSSRYPVVIPEAPPVAGCLAAALLRVNLPVDKQVKARLAAWETDGVEEDTHDGELA